MERLHGCNDRFRIVIALIIPVGPNQASCRLDRNGVEPVRSFPVRQHRLGGSITGPGCLKNLLDRRGARITQVLCQQAVFIPLGQGTG